MLPQIKSTSDLIAGIRCRDAACIESFYDNYSSLLYSLIAREIPNGDEAESVMEEVFCKLATSISSYNPGDRFLTWIIQLTQKEIKGFISQKGERQKKIDAVILDLFFMQKAPTCAYASS